MTNYQRSAIGVALILIITFCGTFLISEWARGFGRIDTTEIGVFSLSEGSERIIDKLQKPLSIKLFYAKEFVDRSGVDQFRELNSLYYYVRDLLRAYEQHAGGRLTVEEFDPKAYTDAEEEADRLRITRYGQGGTGFYFGLAVTSKSGAEQAVASLFDPMRPFDTASRSRIEYQISEAIELATKPKKKALGVLSSLDITGGGMTDMMRQMRAMQGQPVSEPWGSIEVLRRFYEVTDVSVDVEEVDPELDYLLVVHPKNLSDKTLYAIDQFVMRGGKLIAFVDPNAAIADPAPRDPQNPFGGAMSHDGSSSLNRLLNAYGMTVPTDRFVGDPNLMQAIPTRRGRINLVTFLDLNAAGGAGVNKEEPAARGLSRSLLAYLPGAVETSAEVPEGVEFVPILQTTAEGNKVALDRFDFAGPTGPDPQRINEKFSPGATPVAIAARATGLLKSAFPDGDPESPKGDEGEGDESPEDQPADPEAPDEPAADEPVADEPVADEHLGACSEPNTVVVVADVDMLSDGLSFQRALGMLLPISSNPDFLINLVDSLAGSTDLMSIRSRGSFERPFTVVDEIEREADRRTQEQVAKINADIQTFEAELRDKQSQANEQNVGALRGEVVQAQRDVERRIREKRRELNAVQKVKNEDIEALGDSLQLWNVVGVPAVVLLIGVILAWNQRRKRALAARGGVA